MLANDDSPDSVAAMVGFPAVAAAAAAQAGPTGNATPSPLGPAIVGLRKSGYRIINDAVPLADDRYAMMRCLPRGAVLAAVPLSVMPAGAAAAVAPRRKLRLFAD